MKDMHYHQVPLHGSTLSEEALSLHFLNTIFYEKEFQGKRWLFIAFFLHTAFKT